MNSTAKVLKLPSIVKLMCSHCGASADASCNCGAPYLPASKRAAEAITKSPDKSDRAIAAELGIGKDTVRRARTGASAPVDTRVGRDGKVRKLPLKPKKQKPYKPAQSVNDLLGDAFGFLQKCDYRVQLWLKSEQSDHDRQVLMDALHQLANRLSQLAQLAGGFNGDQE